MPYSPPDTPPVRPEQMPQASTPGAAPVPYTGPDSSPDTDGPDPGVSPSNTPGPGVLDGVTGANYVTEAPLAAPNPNPYETGVMSPIYVGGPADAGGRDIVAGSVAAAVASAEARFGELRGDTYGIGSTIGDLMNLPPGGLDPAVANFPGATDPSGGFYDPPRDYGG